MLVLSRNIDESIIIIGSDGPIKIVVTQCYGKVKLGIDAPKHVSIHRQEIYEAINRDYLPTEAEGGDA